MVDIVTAVSVLSIVFIVIRVFNREQEEVSMKKQFDALTLMIEQLLVIQKHCI